MAIASCHKHGWSWSHAARDITECPSCRMERIYHTPQIPQEPAQLTLPLAKDCTKISLIQARKQFFITHRRILDMLQEEIKRARSEGKFAIEDFFIPHTEKIEVKNYLEHLGYVVTEQKIGNTFTVAWLPKNFWAD